jgi:hypothetical protein
MTQASYFSTISGAPVVKAPGGYALFQNYPNPFNPTTIISYQIPEASEVEIKIIDALGREVANLADTVMPAGHHEIPFNAGNLPGGIYFCRFKAGSYLETRKLVLLK